jgi:peptidoglycan/xylan/chitin deacetylase (PgdA/CDA1 family)
MICYRFVDVRLLPLVVCALAIPQAAQAKHSHHRKPAAAAPAPDGAPAKPKSHRSWPLPALGGSDSGAPEVLFTFDDGPGGEITESVLATLRRHGVRAIFFQVGDRLSGVSSRDRIRAIEREILDDGHAIGNHTVHHKDLCRASNAGRIAAEIDDNARMLTELTGMPMVLFRTPYGVRCPPLEAALDERRLHHVHWDIDAEEWKTHDARRTESYIVHHIAQLGDGQRAVVLIHDIHKETAVAIPGVLDFIDAENARRRQTGRHEIKIIGPTDVALERLAPGLPLALAHAEAAVLGFVPGVERALIQPLGGKLAKL